MAPFSLDSIPEGQRIRNKIEVIAEQPMSLSVNFETMLEDNNDDHDFIRTDEYKSSSSSTAKGGSPLNTKLNSCVVQVFAEQDFANVEDGSSGNNLMRWTDVNCQQDQKENFGDENDRVESAHPQLSNTSLNYFHREDVDRSDNITSAHVQSTDPNQYNFVACEDMGVEGRNPEENLEETDEASVNSAAYFDPMDFDASYWVKSGTISVPTVGLAILAASVAITHPILFVVGALTTYGTVTVATKGYQYYFRDELEDDDNDGTPSIASLLHLWCVDANLGNIMCEKNTPIENEKDTILVSNNEITLRKITAQLGDDKISETYERDAETDNTKQDEVILTKTNSPKRASSHTEIAQIRIVKGQSTNSSYKLQSHNDWIASNYPQLANTIMEESVFVGLNAVEFFHVFFDDDAPYNFKVIQDKRGDIDINYGHWSHLPESTPLSLRTAETRLSTLTEETEQSSFPVGLEYHSFQGRTITFKARTNSFLGPPWATTKKTQRFLILSKNLAILESRTDLKNIPFSDRFYIIERWLITATKDLNHYNTHVTSSCEVFFTESCPFESQIRTKSAGTIKDVFSSWVMMATEALKLTERKKIARLSKSNADLSSVDPLEDEDHMVVDNITGTLEDSVENHVPPHMRENCLSGTDAIEVTHKSRNIVSIADSDGICKDVTYDVGGDVESDSVPILKVRSVGGWRNFRRKGPIPVFGSN